MDADAVSSCQYDRACECRGQLPDGTFTDAKFAADYGSSCYAWDNSSCKVTWGSLGQNRDMVRCIFLTHHFSQL